MSKHLILASLQGGKRQLDSTFAAVPDDKVTWSPLEKGRTALDLYSDAAQTCAETANLLESKGEKTPEPGLFERMRAERANWTREDALQAMEKGASRLLAALEALEEEDLDRMVTMPFGGGMTLPLSAWAMMPHRTFVARFAQINYIQTLYGDFDSH